MRYVMALIVGVLAFVLGRNCIAADDCAFRTATKCYSCDEPDAIMVGSSEECTKTCPNREINTRGSGSGNNFVYNCVLKNCPPNKPLRGYFGNCKSCDDTSNDFWSTPNCEVCPNRYTDKDNKCQFKDGRPLEGPYNPPMLPKQKCPPNKPLQQWNNECFSCDTPEEIQIDSAYYRGEKEKLEAVCPNRIIIADVGGNPSSILPCPKEYPLVDYNHLCHSCDEEKDIDLRYNQNLCQRFCAGKRYHPEYGGNCLLCPKDKSKLNPRECSECGGKFTNGVCQ